MGDKFDRRSYGAMRSTSITSALDHMVDQAILKIYRWFTWNVIRLREPIVPDVNSANQFHDFDPDGGLTVGQLVGILKDFPQESLVGFQVGDEMDSQILAPVVVEHDALWEITDIVFREWNE